VASRIPFLTTRYRASLTRLQIVPGSPHARQLAATIRALMVDELPGPQDVETPIPPTNSAWVRRVPGANLWVYFNFDDARVLVGSVVKVPPVPKL
jgi:hypothetical protein